MNSYRNQRDKDGSCQRMDNQACERFIRLAEAKSIKVEESSQKENIEDHIDYWLTKADGKKSSIDVKGLKKSSRHGKLDWEWLWIEYKNVQGNNGWLYGKQDLIAFECPNFFLIVQRKELQELCEKIAPFKPENVVTKPEDAKRKIYSRNGRSDVLTKISVHDIFEHIKYSIWEDDQKIWIQRPYEQTLEKQLTYSPLLNRLLSQRNIQPDNAKIFTEADYESLSHPYTLNDVEKAVELFCNVALNNGTVAIFGDYDCDGIVSATMLSELCNVFGLTKTVFLPCRLKHGYGLNMKSVTDFKEKIGKPTDLLIIADCGSNNYDEIADLKNFGFKNIIIIDHHIIGDKISSNADAFINWRLTEGYGEMCSCGEIYQFIRGIRIKTSKVDPLEFLTYAAIGTIGDVSPLNKDNRIIVRHGLKRYSLNHIVSDGLTAIIQKSRIYTEDLTQYQVSFKIVPQINAIGRLKSPMAAYNLLIEHDQSLAELMAEELHTQNEKRKNLQSEYECQAFGMVKSNLSEYKYAILIHRPDWHVGIVGIIASKVSEKFNKPTIVIGKNGNIWKGSGRTIEGVNLKAILDMLPEKTFEAYGGHEGAVGVTVGEKDPAGLNRLFNEATRKYYALNAYPTRYNYYDAELKISSINLETAKLLHENLFPYSVVNPEPIFLVSNAVISDSEVREGENWSSLSFSLKKGDDVSELKIHMFSPEFGSEIDNRKANVYFSFPQSYEEGKFGKPSLILKDIQLLP